MKIGGFKQQSLIDFPGNISAVVFTQGCNFRCGYCHNPELVLPNKFGMTYDVETIIDYLRKYSKLLDAVCITGGEPTLHKDLPDFIARINKLGLKVKLDSNGTNPEMLQYLINSKLVCFIAMDVKQVLNHEAYNQVVGNCMDEKIFTKVLKSIKLIENSGIDYEFRTTVVKGIHCKEQIKTLKKQFGANYKIQDFNPEVVLNSGLNLEPFSKNEYNSLF